MEHQMEAGRGRRKMLALTSAQVEWNVPATRRIGLITTRAGGKSVQASRLRHTAEKPGRRWPSTATMKDVAGHLGKLEAR